MLICFVISTNVPDIAMCYSDLPFPYGPFVPHYIARQYVENYFSAHKTDEFLVLDTTLEDLSSVPAAEGGDGEPRWKLTLRRHDPVRRVDVWWEEVFDAVVLANGHYSVPYVRAILCGLPWQSFHPRARPWSARSGRKGRS